MTRKKRRNIVQFLIFKSCFFVVPLLTFLMLKDLDPDPVPHPDSPKAWRNRIQLKEIRIAAEKARLIILTGFRMAGAWRRVACTAEWWRCCTWTGWRASPRRGLTMSQC
jgi:hypothetical protein